MRLQDQKIRRFSKEEIQSQLQKNRSSSYETKYQRAQNIENILIEEYYLTKQDLKQINQESSIFENYLITGKIGAGRFGIVYKAIQTNLGNRKVVIKFIQPQTADHKKLFERQVEALGKLQHENIITAIESGKISNVYYLVLEYFHGTQLDEYVKGMGTLSEESTLEIAQSLASTLQHIWSKNLIHRDISPKNIMIGKKKVKLCDFNLIRAIESNQEHTRGIPISLYDYSAPEITRGGKVSFNCDCFSLGATLYFCVSGYSPFETPTERNIRRRVHYPLRNVAPKISKSLDKFICQLLSNTPNERCKLPEDLTKEIDILIKKHKKKSLYKTILLSLVTIITLGYAFVPARKENIGEKIYKERAKCLVLVEAGESLGSGIIIKHKSKILVITNAHVITNNKSNQDNVAENIIPKNKVQEKKNQNKVKISLANGKSYYLKIIKVYQNQKTNKIDIAILDFSNNPHRDNIMPIATKSRIGQTVYAMGHPKGYKWSITQGIVSAIRGDFIQTDTPINPGNSGGPLLDKNGEMVGMNTYLINEANSIGFALSVGKIWKYLDNCANEGYLSK